MVVYRRFEDLPVWKLAKDLEVEFMKLPRKKNFKRIMLWLIKFEEPQFLFQVTLLKDSRGDLKRNLSNFYI